jgi:hypothetical protein
VSKVVSQCVYCGAPLTAETLTVDHVIPRCRGGSNEAANKAPACADCNQEKGPLTAREYLSARGNKGELKAMIRQASRELISTMDFALATVAAKKRPKMLSSADALRLRAEAARRFEEHREHEKVRWAVEQRARERSRVFQELAEAAEQARARARAEGRAAGT